MDFVSRKWFITQCDRSGISFTTREYISGHRLPNQDASCIRVTEEDRLAEYVKAIPLLTIDSTQRLVKENQEWKSTQSREIARLQWREGQQAQEIAELKAALAEWEPAKELIQRLEGTMEQLRQKTELLEDKITFNKQR